MKLENKVMSEVLEEAKTVREKLFITDRLSCYLGDMLKHNITLTDVSEKIKYQYDKKVGTLRNELTEIEKYISREVGE